MNKRLMIIGLFLLFTMVGCGTNPMTTSTDLTTNEVITSTENTTTSETTTLPSTEAPTTTIPTLPTTTITETTDITSCEDNGLTGCDFVLAEAMSDGSFSVLASYEFLSESQTILKRNTNPNYVILNTSNKVLAMKYGAVNFKTKSINETTTLGHTGFHSPTYINGNYNVDGVYLESEGIVIHGMIAGVRFEVVNTEVELIPHIHLNNAYSYYEVVNGELVHRIAYNLRTADFQSIGAIDLAPEYLEDGYRYYSYDNHYFYTDFKVMTDDLRNDTYENAVNANQPYYNYYQYLSFRTKTNYTAEELNDYINSNTSTTSGIYDAGQDFINAQEEVYINGAMELAFAIHESGWGNSLIAKNKNNLFGINAYDSDPYNSATSFDTIQDCIEYHVQYFLGTRYFDPNYHVAFGTNFGNKYQGMNYKYASDAFWGEKIAKHYYQLDKALGFKDRNSYKIALLKPEALGYYSANTSSPVLYNPENYNYRGLWVTFPVMKEKDDYYVLRLPLGLNDNLQMSPYEVMEPTDVFYVLKEDVIIVN
ncbi:MAG: N-acetylglucosaminidase [Candidatus Izemoplasmatales bacterium]